MTRLWFSEASPRPPFTVFHGRDGCGSGISAKTYWGAKLIASSYRRRYPFEDVWIEGPEEVA